MAVPTLGVVIPTRTADGGADAAAAVLDDVVHEIVVVNDDPAGERGVITKCDDVDPRVRMVESGGLGSSGARQVGAEEATSEVILFVDDDVIADPGLAAGHLAHHVGRTQHVVLGYMPTVLPATRRLDDVPARVYAASYEWWADQCERDPGYVLSNLWAGNMSLRRDDALRVELMGPVHFDRHEDRDFGLRCREAGFTAAFDRRLRGEHHADRSFASMLRAGYEYGYDDARLALVHAGDRFETSGHSSFDALPRPARWYVSTATVPGLHKVTEGAVQLACAVLRTEAVTGLQVRCGRVAEAMANQRGYAAAQRPELRDEVARLLAETD